MPITRYLKHECRIDRRIKAPKKNSKSVKEVAPAGRLFTKKYKFLTFWGPHSHPSAPIDVKFRRAKRTQVPVDLAEFDLNRCNESPLRGEKPDFFGLWVNLILTASNTHRYAAILPVMTHVNDTCSWSSMLIFYYTMLLNRSSGNTVDKSHVYLGFGVTNLNYSLRT